MRFSYEECGIRRHYLVGRGSFTIGRDEEADLVLADRQVSKIHASCELVDGRLVIRDAGSTNGILVNGTRVPEHTLEDGDRVEIGGFSLVFDAQLESEKAVEQSVTVAGEEMPFLVAVRGTGQDRSRHAITKPSFTIGSREGNDIVVGGEGVSRFHAEVFLREDRWWVKDLGSRNGTFVNGEKRESAALEPGDEFQIGRAVFRFRTRRTPGFVRRWQALPSHLRIAAVGLLLGVFVLLARSTSTPPPPPPPVQEQTFRSAMVEAIDLLDRKEYRAAQERLSKIETEWTERKGIPKALQEASALLADVNRDVFALTETQWQVLQDRYAEVCTLAAEATDVPEFLQHAGREKARIDLEFVARRAYGAGKRHEADEDLPNALASYREVPRASAFYGYAQHRIQTLEGDLARAALAEGERLREARDWQNASLAYRTAENYGGTRLLEVVRLARVRREECRRNRESQEIFDQANALYGAGELFQSAEMFDQVPPHTVYRSAAEEAARRIRDEAALREAVERYRKGDGDEALFLCERIIAERRSRQAERHRDHIREVLRAWAEAKNFYGASNYGAALVPLARILELEEDDPENRYLLQARDLARDCWERMSQEAQHTEEAIIDALKAGRYTQAMAQREALGRQDLDGSHVERFRSRLVRSADDLFQKVYNGIQLAGDEARYPEAMALYRLLILDLPERHLVRGRATEARERLLPELGGFDFGSEISTWNP